MEIADELAAQYRHVVHVLLDRTWWLQTRCCQMRQERTEQRHQVPAGSQIFSQAHPRTWPAVQIPAVVFDSMERRGGSAVYFRSSRRHFFPLHAARQTADISVQPPSLLKNPSNDDFSHVQRRPDQSLPPSVNPQ